MNTRNIIPANQLDLANGTGLFLLSLSKRTKDENGSF
jgi:hypothetical protein